MGNSQINNAVQIVAYAGSAKSAFIETIEELINGKDIQKIKEIYNSGCESFQAAHKCHHEILTRFANDEVIDTNILLVHAECQLMSAEDFKTIAGQFIQYFEKKGNCNE